MHRLGIAVAFTFACLQAQQVTPAPHGPFRVVDHRLIDSNGRRFLIRGTNLPEFRGADVAHLSRSGSDFGPYSATALSAIRLRFNMNAVRLAVNPADAARPELARLARLANDLELLVIVAGPAPAALRDYPNVVSDEGLDLARGWEPDFDDDAACAKLPPDPAAVSRMVMDKLAGFDARGIDWVVSSYEPGKLVDDLFQQDATSLENGWTCGRRTAPRAGVGRLVQAHMRASVERGLFVVSAAGGVDVSRGGYAIAYGPVMAARDGRGDGMSVHVTDAAGGTRPALIRWASAGWGQLNFVVPAESATGPARIVVRRADGSRATANIDIVDTAPGFWTGVSCAGPATGYAVGAKLSQISACASGSCRTLPVAPKARVRLSGSGFRFAGAASDIEVTVGGVRVPVVSFGAGDQPGLDQVTIELPASLAGRGETDVICRVKGRIANVVRLRV